jgi:hypothetical protein
LAEASPQATGFASHQTSADPCQRAVFSLTPPPPPPPSPTGHTALIEVVLRDGFPVICAVCRSKEEASYPLLQSVLQTLKGEYSELKGVLIDDGKHTAINPPPGQWANLPARYAYWIDDAHWTRLGVAASGHNSTQVTRALALAACLAAAVGRAGEPQGVFGGREENAAFVACVSAVRRGLAHVTAAPQGNQCCSYGDQRPEPGAAPLPNEAVAMAPPDAIGLSPPLTFRSPGDEM